MKKLLYFIFGVIALYLILCIFGPAQNKVERSIEINADPEWLRSKITDLRFFHDEWSPWTEKDPKMKVTFKGEAGQEGSSMSWISDNEEVGKGSMTYNRTSGDTIIQTLHFDDYGDSKIYHIVSASGKGSKVTWAMESENPFFFRAMMLFMNMDKMIGPDFEKGLAKLKTATENGASEAGSLADYEIHEMSWTAKTFYGKREKNLKFDKMEAFFGNTFGGIGETLGKARLEPVGAPKAIFFAFDEKNMIADVAAVMEVEKDTKFAAWEKFEIPAGKVLHIAYYGPYDASMNAHLAMDAYMKKHNLSQSHVVEEYVTDPMTEKDPSKWLTNIYYVLK